MPATHHQGEPPTAEHGFPLSLIVPHLYGYTSSK
ncbi:molybdopterin-dependent oxidoreductase [Streptomyces sp. NPDC051664]